MAALTAAAIAGFIGSIVTGIVGARVDAKAMAWWNRRQAEGSSDLEQAVRWAFLKAQSTLCDECLKSGGLRPDHRQWLEERKQTLENAVKRLCKQDYVPPPLLNLLDISRLLLSREHVDSDTHEAMTRQLVGVALDRHDEPPDVYRVELNKSLWSLMSAFFMVQVKTDAAVERAFHAELESLIANEVVSQTPMLRNIEDKVTQLLDRVTQVLDRPPLPSPGRMRDVPRGHNDYFSGRKGLLDEIRSTLTASGRPVALHGLAGVGKTQAAVEYALRCDQSYTHIFWVQAENSAVLANGLAAYARRLQVVQQDETDNDAAAALRRWLEQQSDWLLVFDNVRAPESLTEYLPRGAAGHVLITTLNPNWAVIAELIPVLPLDLDAGADFLQRRTRRAEPQSARYLAAELGGLPLALAQAAAYIEKQSITIADYFARYRTHKQTVLNRVRAHDYSETVGATLEMSFNAAIKETPVAADLLRLCAFLAPDDIPLSLAAPTDGSLPGLLEALSEPLAVDDAAGALRGYSLVEVNREERTLSVHRLVQLVVRDQLAVEDHRRWVEAAGELVARAFPYEADELATWGPSSRLLPHALAVAAHTEVTGASSAGLVWLLSSAGQYLSKHAMFATAKTLLTRGLVTAEAVYDPKHPSVATLANHLGLVLQDLGDLAGAGTHFERALAIHEAVFGPNHSKVATGVNNLGLVLQALGDLEGARVHFERALTIEEVALGPNHPKVAHHVNNLGGVLLELGDLTGARAHFERALAIDEAAFGPNHPNVGVQVNNLGGVLQTMGDLRGARAHFELALAIDEAAFGPNHTNVANRMNNLGGVLQDLGDLAGARAQFERALAIDKAAFGPNHPQVATEVNNLGSVLQKLNDLAGARAHYERALAIHEAAFGPSHPKVAVDVNNLGSVLRDLGDLAGARAHFERALAIDEAAFGPNHLKIATRLHNLGLLLKDLGDLAGARANFERALTIDEGAFGPNHPNVAADVSNLGLLLQAVGDLAGARTLFERALAIDEAALGPNHPNVANRVYDLGLVLKELGDLAGARAQFERALGLATAAFGPDHPAIATISQNLNNLPGGIG